MLVNTMVNQNGFRTHLACLVVSQLTDIPMEVLDSFLDFFEKGQPVSIFFEEEGSDFTVNTFLNGTEILVSREEEYVLNLDTNIFDLAKESINDFEYNIDEWADWMCYLDNSEEDLLNRKTEIENKIVRLKELISNYVLQ